MNERICQHIVGFDLGDGETAAAIAPLDGNDEPGLIDVGGKKSQITALGYLESGIVVIGDEARQNRHVTRLLVRFKRSPNHVQFNRIALLDFFQFYVQFLAREYKLPIEEARFIVGSPSGWSNEERERYGEVLRSAGAGDLCIVPESRAAFLHARESGQFRKGEMEQTVLVIDIGSSTTDFTVVQNLHEKEAADFGHVRLGAGLIESAMLEEVLRVQVAAAEVQAVLDRNPHLRAICEARCRDAKEAYFSAQNVGKDTSQLKPLIEVVDATNILRISVDNRLMEQVLNQPSGDLDGKSWLNCYRDELNAVKEKWCDTPFAAVLMTGGGAKMKFTRQICGQVFPNARMIVDPAPEFCIARGLARVGRMDHRAKRFLEQIRTEGRQNVAELVETHCDALFAPLAARLASLMVERVVKPLTYQWRNGDLPTLAAYERRMETELQALGRSSEVATLAQKIVIAWLNDNRDLFLGGIRPILAEFGIPTSVMEIEAIPMDLPPIKSGDKLPIPDALAAAICAVVAAIVGYIVAGICGGAGVAVLMAGPIGFIPGIIIGLLILYYGPQYTADWVKEQQIPTLVRKMCLWDAAIEAQCIDAVPKIDTSIHEELKNDASLKAAIVSSLMEMIERKARETTVWIDC